MKKEYTHQFEGNVDDEAEMMSFRRADFGWHRFSFNFFLFILMEILFPIYVFKGKRKDSDMNV